MSWSFILYCHDPGIIPDWLECFPFWNEPTATEQNLVSESHLHNICQRLDTTSSAHRQNVNRLITALRKGSYANLSATTFFICKMDPILGTFPRTPPHSGMLKYSEQVTTQLTSQTWNSFWNPGAAAKTILFGSSRKEHKNHRHNLSHSPPNPYDICFVSAWTISKWESLHLGV